MTRYICRSCNYEFNEPKKYNKLLKVFGLFLLYILLTIIFVVSIVLLWAVWLLWLVFIIHVIAVVIKDQGRGKCPECGSDDFISVQSIEGQEMIKKMSQKDKQINEYIKKKLEKLKKKENYKDMKCECDVMEKISNKDIEYSVMTGAPVPNAVIHIMNLKKCKMFQ